MSALFRLSIGNSVEIITYNVAFARGKVAVVVNRILSVALSVSQAVLIVMFAVNVLVVCIVRAVSVGGRLVAGLRSVVGFIRFIAGKRQIVGIRIVVLVIIGIGVRCLNKVCGNFDFTGNSVVDAISVGYSVQPTKIYPLSATAMTASASSPS